MGQWDEQTHDPQKLIRDAHQRNIEHDALMERVRILEVIVAEFVQTAQVFAVCAVIVLVAVVASIWTLAAMQ